MIQSLVRSKCRQILPEEEQKHVYRSGVLTHTILKTVMCIYASTHTHVTNKHSTSSNTTKTIQTWSLNSIK